MTISQYQKIYKLEQSTFDDIDKMALIVCEIDGKEPSEVDKMPPLKFLKRINKITKQFADVKKPFYIRNKFITDAKKITAGDFISVQHFIKGDFIDNIHLIAAIALKKKTTHNKDADKISKANIKYVLEDILKFVESYKNLIASYKGLFDLEDEVIEQRKEKPHIFIERYGWLFSAQSVREYYGISLNEVFKLNVLEFLNALSYLKSKQSYDRKMMK